MAKRTEQTKLTFPADPTKEFFVEMLTRDVRLAPALQDLVDNSIDGALRAGQGDLEGYWVDLKMDGDSFVIEDNCGGIPFDIAQNYAFRFGRPPGVGTSHGSLGRFGVGMKRSLFKLGHKFTIHTTTPSVSYDVAVDLREWVVDPEWNFPCTNKVDHAPPLGLEECGTKLVSSDLRDEVKIELESTTFWTNLKNLLRKTYRKMLQEGFMIKVQGEALSAPLIELISGEGIEPATKSITYRPEGSPKDVTLTAVVGIVRKGDMLEAGWYVFCNDRLVVEAAKTPDYGFERGGPFPSPHPQYARFRGFLYIDCDDTAQLPWTTAKHDIDTTRAVFRKARAELMFPLAREVRVFLDDIKAEVQENKEDTRPLMSAIAKAPQKVVQKEVAKAASRSFKRPAFVDAPKDPNDTVSIQYRRPKTLVNRAMKKLKVDSAAKVGEKTFDLYAERAGIDDG